MSVSLLAMRQVTRQKMEQKKKTCLFSSVEFKQCSRKKKIYTCFPSELKTVKWRLWNPIKNIFIPYEHKTGKDECLLFLSCEKIKFFTRYSTDVIVRKMVYMFQIHFSFFHWNFELSNLQKLSRLYFWFWCTPQFHILRQTTYGAVL